MIRLFKRFTHFLRSHDENSSNRWGAGFIGSAVIRHILQTTQVSVVNLNKLTYAGNFENLSAAAALPRYAFEQVNICVFVENRKSSVR